MPEIQEVIDNIGRTHKELTDRIDKMEKEGGGALAAEAIAKVNAAITEFDKVKAHIEKTNKLEATIEDLKDEIARRQTPGGGNPKVDAHHNAFEIYMRHGKDSDQFSQVKAELTTKSDPDGGFRVPETYEKSIERVALATSSFASLVSTSTISGQTYKRDFTVSGAGYAWGSEGGTVSETDTPTLAQVKIDVEKLTAYPFITEEMIADADFNIEAWLAEEVGYAFDEGKNTASITGNGVEKPKGILSYTNVLNASWVWGKIGYTASGHATLINDHDRLITFQNSLKTKYQGNAKWLMNLNTQEALRVLKLGDGSHIWKPGMTEGAPNTLFGKPVVLDDYMPDIGANTYPIAYADFKRAYRIVNRSGIAVLRNPFAVMGKVGYYTRQRIGGGVENYEAIKLLKVAA